MVIIAVGVAAMGALPGAVSYVWAGWKPKRTGMDLFDYQMEKRDRQLMEAKARAAECGTAISSPVDYCRRPCTRCQSKSTERHCFRCRVFVSFSRASGR